MLSFCQRDMLYTVHAYYSQETQVNLALTSQVTRKHTLCVLLQVQVCVPLHLDW